MSTDSDFAKVGRAAVRWALLDEEKRNAWEAFCRAWGGCFSSNPDVASPGFSLSVPIFERRLSQPNGDYVWVYTSAFCDGSGSTMCGESCTSHPLWIAQHAAWLAHKAAAIKAAQARGVLTKMAKRLAAVK